MGRSWLACALALLLLPAASAEDAPVRIAWRTDLAQALAEAATSRRPVFVAINAERVDGGRVEPASRLLRETTYLDPRVVERSRAFVCVLLRDPISDADGGVLRQRYEVEGLIVSPQHLLLHADGTLIQRREYWPYGDGPASVEALLAMLTRATKAHEVRQALPPLADGSDRGAWIRAAQGLIRAGADIELRRAAARALVAADREADCLAALQALLAEVKDPPKPEAPLWIEVLCLLARPGAQVAVAGLAALLDAKEPLLRSHAAVSLEHVGSSSALEPVLKRLGKEREEGVKANLLRAAARCGANDAAVRRLLLREAQGRSERVAVGAILGLAYFEGDADAARGLEKALKSADEGPRRIAILWSLVEVGERGTGEVLRAELLAAQPTAPSLHALEAAAACFGGEREARRPQLDGALRWSLGERLLDPARGGRRGSGFVPKGDAPPAD